MISYYVPPSVIATSSYYSYGLSEYFTIMTWCHVQPASVGTDAKCPCLDTWLFRGDESSSQTGSHNHLMLIFILAVAASPLPAV